MINQIDLIRCMTIEYRKDKQVAMESAMAMVDAPGEKFGFFFSPCGNDELPEDVRDVAAMMVDDGFSELVEIKEKGHWRKPSWLVADWSKMRGLRYIAGGKENVWLCSDTNYPCNMYYPHFEESLGMLINPSVVFLGGYIPENSSIATSAYTRLEETTCSGIYSNMSIYAHPSAVFTPRGAARLLDFWLKNPHLNFPETTFEMGKVKTMNSVFICKPDKVKNVKWDSGYSFVGSDKQDWGPYFDVNQIKSETRSEKSVESDIDPLKVNWWRPRGDNVI